MTMPSCSQCCYGHKQLLKVIPAGGYGLMYQNQLQNLSRQKHPAPGEEQKPHSVTRKRQTIQGKVYGDIIPNEDRDYSVVANCWGLSIAGLNGTIKGEFLNLGVLWLSIIPSPNPVKVFHFQEVSQPRLAALQGEELA